MSADALTIGDVLEATGGQLRGSGDPAQVLSSVSVDSRSVRPGALFIALRGRKLGPPADAVPPEFRAPRLGAVIRGSGGLGHTATGVMGTDPALVRELLAAGERADERGWELPLWDDYRELNKSDIADVKNSGGRPAGSITAAWFLREFVESFAWAHLDVAGTAYTDREDAALVKGPTGVGVRLFSEFILGRAGMASS